MVVTGASAGIGRATAVEFARLGDTVVLLARGEEGLAAAADDVERTGGRAVTYSVDMSDHHAVNEVAERIETEVGPVDVWVNVAFSAVFARFTDVEPEEFKRVTEVTYLGYVNGTRAALTHMLPRDKGVIVQVGSALGHRGIPLQSAYCGAKHALEGFHESLRTELLGTHTRVATTIVEMPAVNTPQFQWVLSRLPNAARPVAPVYQPEVAARAVVHAAAHPRRRSYWVGASTVGTIMANRVIGGLLDRYLARTGITSQQTDHPRDPDRPVNLWRPADGPDGHDYGAHGPFDDEALGHSLQQWASRRRDALTTPRRGGALPVRPADAARLTLGAALLAVPGPFLTAAGSPTDRALLRAARVLGVRYVVQSLAAPTVHRPWVRAADTGVDLVHALSMVVLGRAYPAHRRLAHASAAAALVFACLDATEATREEQPDE